MDKPFILNLVHRLELSPEYSQKTNGAGGKEDAFTGALTSESVEIFKTQQRLAHENGLKTTIQLTYASLFSDECVELAKADHEKYGDEISLSLLGLPCPEFKSKYKTKDFCIWMFSDEDKRAIIDDVFGLFEKKLGFYPHSTGSYYLDAYCLNYIHEKYPSVKAAVATCFEEGPKAYHTCNNSWYTFLDGGPWNPWIPSKENTHCPASDAKDDCGIVCIPHLSRDVMACFDGNGSNFGTHPQNVLRGMIYDHKRRIPYLYNLIDQYRHLGKWNRYAYNMMFVGPGWMNRSGRWEVPYEGLYKSYEDAMRYHDEQSKAQMKMDADFETAAHELGLKMDYGILFVKKEAEEELEKAKGEYEVQNFWFTKEMEDELAKTDHEIELQRRDIISKLEFAKVQADIDHINSVSDDEIRRRKADTDAYVEMAQIKNNEYVKDQDVRRQIELMQAQRDIEIQNAYEDGRKNGKQLAEDSAFDMGYSKGYADGLKEAMRNGPGQTVVMPGYGMPPAYGYPPAPPYQGGYDDRRRYDDYDDRRYRDDDRRYRDDDRRQPRRDDDRE